MNSTPGHLTKSVGRTESTLVGHLKLVLLKDLIKVTKSQLNKLFSCYVVPLIFILAGGLFFSSVIWKWREERLFPCFFLVNKFLNSLGQILGRDRVNFLFWRRNVCETIVSCSLDLLLIVQSWVPIKVLNFWKTNKVEMTKLPL